MATLSRTSITHILFDLDGTLIDTEHTAALSIQRCFDRWGVKIDFTDANYITGRKWEAAFELLFRKYPLPVSPKQAEAQILAEYRESLERELKVVPGAADCVRALAREFPLALVSGSNREDIVWALKKLGVLELFPIILGAEDYPRSKPAPDGYEKALKLMSAQARNALIFEDSDAGIASARAAGARVVALSSTNHFGQKPANADEVIADLRGIDPGWVNDFAKRFSLQKT